MAVTAAWYQSVRESLIGALTDLDVSDYAWDDSDGWTEATTAGLTSHLEVWCDLGGVTEVCSQHIVHDAALVWACRYQPDTDSLSQGIIHASARAAIEAMLLWRGPDGLRARPTGYTLELAPTTGHVIVTLSLSLIIPRS